MSIVSRSIKFLFIFLALVLLALLALVATFDANNYKTQIIEQVETATGRDFTIDGDINLSLFPWIGLKLEGVSLGNEKGFKAKHFVAIKQLDIKVNVLPLLKKEVEINTIRLHGLDVSLEVAKNKSNNWSGLSQPTETDNSDVTAKAETDKANADSAIPAADKEGGLPLQSLKIEGFEFVDAVIRYHDRSSNVKATISELNLTTNEIQFNQAVELNFAARIVNHEPAIDSQIKLSTQLTFTKTLNEFDLRDFVFTVMAEANEFVPQKEKIEIKANINVLMEEQRVALDKVELSALGITTLMELRVSQFLQSPVVQGSVEVQPFDGRKVAKRVAVELPGMADANALKHLALKTKIELRGEKFQANDFQFTLDKSNLSGWIHVLDISKQQLRYELIFDQLNVNDYMPAVVAQAAVNNSDRAGAPVKNVSASVADVDTATGDEKIELPLEMMRQLDLQGDFRITRLTALDYDIRQFLIKTKAKKGVIDIEPMSMKLLEGQLKTVVNIDARKEIPAYTVNLNLNQIQVAPVANPFLDGLMGEKPLSMEGRMNLKMNVKAQGETVNQLKKASKGKIVLDMKQTAVHGFDPEYYMRSSVADYISSKGLDLSETIMSNYKPRQVTVFDKIFSTFNLADGKARTNDFIMSSKRVVVGAKGDIDIVNNEMDMMTSVKLPRGKTSFEKIFNEPMFVHVFGPFDALEYKIDTSKLKSSTTDVLRNQAKAKLDVEKKRLKARADAEKQRLKAKADAEVKRAEERAKQELKKKTDSYKDKLKNKFKGLF